jgi:hypothetical protein
MSRLIIPDVDIVRAINVKWPDPYQTEVMGTIALCESGGNLYANNPVSQPESLFYRWDDRGILGINEGAINEVLRQRIDPRTCYIIEFNIEYGRAIWDWRLAYALKPTSHGGLGFGYSNSLIWAYQGWTTYKNRTTDENLSYAWPIFRKRIQTAIKDAGIRP